MKQRLDKEERLAQQVDAQALARRRFLQRAAGLAAVTAMAPAAFARNFGPSTEPQRYPDPDIIALDKRFKYKLGNTPIQRLYTGTLWAEGCAWNGASRYLVWSDIPRNENLRYLEEDDHVSRMFRSPSMYSNGNTFDYSGRQMSFCHGLRDVRRYEHDGSVTVLAAKNDQGKDPTPRTMAWRIERLLYRVYRSGLWRAMNYEGKRYSTDNVQPFIKEAVYRIDAQNGKVTRVTDEPFKPNGMCFSADYKKVYIADMEIALPQRQKHHLGGRCRWRQAQEWQIFAEMTLDGKTGFADGIRCDEDCNAGPAWGGGRRRPRRAYLCAR